MGRLLGAHDSDELDRPDLNKCPDCGCFFPQDNCPLCGKECPEEYRAGNRKKVKPQKHKNSSGRVTFVEWYHRWWFIAIMMFVMPVVGIVLLITSPHKKWVKVLAVLLAVAYMVSGYLMGSGVISKMMNVVTEPVERLPFEEYSQKCVKLTPEEFYRGTVDIEDPFVTMTLTVEEAFVDGQNPDSEYNTFYTCTDAEGSDIEIIVRDCRTDAKNLVKGDVITIYGESVGTLVINDLNWESHWAPTVYAAYITHQE